ncbi:hypothetical protein [Nereida sp. MMG025]|uniref:hypothetical protein n=1 Tax=Nereida sp. MMG025 TaxID=2909981 RepID=UPI001F3FC699|nr:hypothetical protein [Nereida sp. MMG025]MCF6443710.1 hypothetical protein [Nereida sp. MMG025]
MKPPAKLLFLERNTYRRRRIGDAIKMLPILGVILFLLPLLWGSRQEPALTSITGLYIFCVWGGLVIGLLVLTRLRGKSAAPPESDSWTNPQDPTQ